VGDPPLRVQRKCHREMAFERGISDGEMVAHFLFGRIARRVSITMGADSLYALSGASGHLRSESRGDVEIATCLRPRFVIGFSESNGLRSDHLQIRV
jgi:hypothetical protein